MVDEPYVFPPYPKMLYRCWATPTGEIKQDQRKVATVSEETLATAEGWFPHPQVATEAAERAFQEQQTRDRQADERRQSEVNQAGARRGA